MTSYKIVAVVLPLVIYGNMSIAGQSQTKSNTFVGNGGNAGDLELQMTLGQIERAARFMGLETEFEDETFCECAPTYSGRPICEPLKEMNDEQKKYCKNNLKAKAEQILALLSQGEVKWDWSDQKITVAESAGVRDSDAVADSKNKRITLERARFISQRPPERVFLVTHELLHLTKSDGEYMSDEKPIGPFKERDGSRHLLNAYGSSVAMYAQTKGVYEADTNSNARSKNYVNNWFSFALGSRSKDQTSTFSMDGVSGSTLEYRRKFANDWGAFARFRNFKETKDVLNSTEVEADETAGAIGVNRQFSFFDDPMTFWGQSFLLLGAGVEYMHSDYKVDDGFVIIKDKDDSVAVLVRTQYYFPLVSGLWAFVELSATNHNYKFNEVNVKSTSVQTQSYIGVSYAF